MVADRKYRTNTTLYRQREWIKLEIKINENEIKISENIVKDLDMARTY